VFEEKDKIFEEENQKKLIEQIKTSSDCRIFGASRFIEGTYVSESGIARETKWRKVAIPWENIEYIEIKDKGSDIDYIIFRSGTISLTCTNSSSANKLSLDIVSEYVGEIERWPVFDDLKETAETTDSDRIYMRPDIDRTTGRTRLEAILLRECIGEVDFDVYSTQEQTSARSDEEIFERIMNDPQCECLFDCGNLARFIGSNKVVHVMLIVAVAASIGGMLLMPYTVLLYSIAGIMFALMFYGLIKGGEKLVISPIGIARFIFGNPEAIEWQYIEYINLQFDEDILVRAEFFGNRRRIVCADYTSKHLVSMDLIRKYIYDIDEWKKTERKSLGEGEYRIIRPEA
jgi:hypothetical protein